MVISVLEHGLGNQLFQYAAGRAMADRLNTALFLDKMRYRFNRSRELGINQFRIRARILPDGLARLLSIDEHARGVKALVRQVTARWVPTLRDTEHGYDERIFTAEGACRLDGFWQSERYFRPIRAQLLEELEPREALSGPLADLALRMANEVSVAVHVRRGDVTIPSQYAAAVGALTVDYYAEALRTFRVWAPDARFYVFSDDPAWCKARLPRFAPVQIVSGQATRSAVEDLSVMKHCRHFITGNSTFSWWGAWLGDHPQKRVLAPARFFRVPVGWERDLRPVEWKTMEPVFEAI